MFNRFPDFFFDPRQESKLQKMMNNFNHVKIKSIQIFSFFVRDQIVIKELHAVSDNQAPYSLLRSG